MKLKIKKLHPDAVMPTYATEDAACFDLYAVCDTSEQVVFSQMPTVFRTGLAFEIPTGCAMMLYSRSGHAFKADLRLANCVGVIDSDYRGEVMVKMTKDSYSTPTMPFKTGDRIAQAMLIKTPQIGFEFVEDLTATARGEQGFGHTG